MREVSCRGLEVIERAAAENGLRFEDLVHGLPVTLETLRDRGERIDWEVFAEIFERFERATNPEASLRAGRAVVDLELAKPVAALVGLALNASHFYRFGPLWLLPVIVRGLRVRIDEVAPRELRIELTIPDNLVGCTALLRSFHGTFEMVPTSLHLPPARVKSELSSHRGVYHVTLPEQRPSLLARLRARLSRTALAKLEEQIEELRALERERFKVDLALREREHLLSNLIANLSGVVYRCRPDDFSFQFASGRCQELTGYTGEELVQQVSSLFALVHPEDRENFRESLRSELVTRQPASNAYRVRTRAGELRWVLDVARGEYAADGRLLCIDGFMTDITAKKQLEQELNHAMRVEGIGRLAGGIAHDFNNLLTVMLGSAELAQLLLPEGSPARELTEQIQSAAERAGALTRQLLMFARKQVLKPRVTDLNTIVLGVDKLLRRTLGSNVEITTVLAPDLWCVEVDPGQCEQVLLNLSVNSRDAMPQGGTLTIETANIVLEERTPALSGVQPGLYVMLAVRDTGVGMSEETRDRAFEPFFTTKEIGHGTGLGLASCHGFIAQARGQMLVTSELGRGTEVRIYLPRAEGAAEPLEHEPVQSSPGGRETILVVEDHDLVRRMSVRTLATQGYEVLAAASGSEALELASEAGRVIDLLMTDVVMAQMSGFTLAARLVESRPNLPVLYVSGYSERAAVPEQPAGTCVEFLAKPFTAQSLVVKVREVLDLAAARSSGQPKLRLAR
ncbi:MAG: Blue-light-activated protein [Myxococcaceae bacterium]|nr:Blue-light-activated protein [Myxococcaceae bacterium]